MLTYPAVKPGTRVLAYYGKRKPTLFLDFFELAEIDVRRIMVRIHGTKFSFIELEWRANQTT